METTTNTDVVPVRQTAAERRSLPDFRSVAQDLADEHTVCRRPVPMRTEDPKTLTVSYVGSPCKSTVASVCPSCAAKARYLRMTQCREGWHLDTEPVNTPDPASDVQKDLLRARSDLYVQYKDAVAAGDGVLAAAVKDIATSLDVELRETGFRGRLPAFDASTSERRQRSTRRRQDAPNLPRKKVTKTTVGKVIGGYRSSMMVTLTMPSYGSMNQDGAFDAEGKPCGDGSPRRPDEYDYTRAARDIVHFSKLVDRWIQNLRRVVGYDVQYFATVEPQRRGAPHLHLLLRSAISREILRLVTAATYHQVWWPHHDQEVYSGDRLPVWDHTIGGFTDPDTGTALPTWDQALDVMDSVDELEPAYVVRFGERMDAGDMKGYIPGPKADRAIGYVTKYLTKSIGEVLDTDSTRTGVHYDRLHDELCRTPCSPRCGVWLRYGIVPKGASDKTVPGRCKSKAHRRDTLGLPGRRVLVSRRWSNKTLPDHKADRAEFVRQLLRAVGIVKPDRSHVIVTPVENGDKNVPPRDHLIMAAISQRITWRAEYDKAMLAAGPPAAQETSAIRQAA
ncbi:replication initiator [Nocardia sp. NPDC049190]|uniref:replication initiator n=1 Tax=Nocardia sp. NPDC049190 TaxID=3155650 RepID=UPI0033C33F9E